MPELPEVETVRRGLQHAMEGARICGVELRRTNLRFPFPDGFAEALTNRTVISLSRRAKYLLIHLDSGMTIVSHLGMSGSFRVEYDNGGDLPGAFHHPRGTSGPHDHVLFNLEHAGGKAVSIIYNDPRRFGFMLLAQTSALESHPSLSGLGIEPLGNELSGAKLAGLFAGKAAPLKASLLDQGLVAGLGNIYVCEALWRSGLSPLLPAGLLHGKSGKAALLAQMIRDVLTEAVEAGGSSLRDHRLTDGTLGYFQHRFAVYDREGEPCPRVECKGVVARMVQSGRSTFYCPTCQREQKSKLSGARKAV
ncbi:MAG: bifunctional DNA-formamidopyrimidine glycosylase/DNA-(apurinic or apyrimidinic site) lyase [Rhizobiaceae bacterium]